MRSTHKKGTLYMLARQAKSRLKNFNRQDGTYPCAYFKQNSYTSKDELLYKKVCKMLDSEQIITNPIMELIDKPYYNSLPIQSRQRYIFELTDKYKQMKERYLKEKNSSYQFASNY